MSYILLMASIQDLKSDHKNARKRTDRSSSLIKESLEKFGAARSIVIDEENRILAGNGTIEGAKAAGIKNLRVIETDGKEIIAVKRTGLTEEDKVGLALADNRTSDLSEWDAEMLKQLSEEQDLEPWFNEGDLAELIGEPEKDKGLTDPDDAPEVPEEPITKEGDLYILGNHRLLCGDSTNIQHVEKLMENKKADMVFTDPPYGMFLNTDWSGIQGSMKSIGAKAGTFGNKYKKVIGDNEDFTPDLINTIFASFSYCKEIFVWGADYFAELLPNKNDGSWLVWDKRKESQAEAIGSEFELCWSKSKHKRRMLRHDWFGFLSSSNPIEARNRVHPTQKPTSLCEDVMSQWGNTGDIVADLYGGSGTTLIAAERTNRHAYLMELDPKYCDVIVKRWEDFTGNKAKHVTSN